MQRQKFGWCAAAVAAVAVLAACGSESDAGSSAATDSTVTAEAGTSAPVTTAAPDGTSSTVAAGTSSTTPATMPTTTAGDDRPDHDPGELRGVRYCEVLLLGKEGDDFVAHVWNTMGHSECPQEQWETLDPAALAAEHGYPVALLNGPRYWTLDAIDATMQFDAPVADFGGIGMFEAATLNLGPELPAQTPYTERGVARDTVFRFRAGTMVHELTAPTGAVYVMQSFSLMRDPTQTLDTLASLGERLQLPDGWTFTTRVLDSELALVSLDGIATVVQDELQNTYQRVDTAQ